MKQEEIVDCTKYLIKFKKIHKEAIIPAFSKPLDSGMDLRSVENTIVKCGEITKIHTGLCVEFPDPKGTFPYTLEMQIRPRSGLASKRGIIVVNTPATIDNGYRGELIILLTTFKNEIYKINIGDRIAQAVIVPVLSSNILEIKEVQELNKTERNLDGFGSTGIK